MSKFPVRMTFETWNESTSSWEHLRRTYYSQEQFDEMVIDGRDVFNIDPEVYLSLDAPSKVRYLIDQLHEAGDTVSQAMREAVGAVKN